MEELIKRLAELQAERIAEDDAANANPTVIRHNEEIAKLEKQLAKVKQARAEELSYYAHINDDTSVQIEWVKEQIILAWDGEKKTLRFDAGTLKFRTTQTLKINEETLLLDELLEHLPLYDVVKYISSFNKTAIRKYLTVHPLSIEVVELVPKTTVSLTTE